LVAGGRRLGYRRAKGAHLMSYVRHVLQNGEKILYEAKIHWINSVPGWLVLLAALLVYVFAESVQKGQTILHYIAGLVALLGLAMLFFTWFTRWTTEIAVTDRRIIFKEGFIRRKTVEMHMDKIESVDVGQSILGRVLDYGDVIVKGTGTGFEPLKSIEAPLDLRNHITGI
jgi:uncharacterized membrane protein YdbT with pleckstrin-like domain